ncbi:hypothetical protein SAMN06296386_11496 [Lachnospiraceae bacterium]|nr:hypothetical protein SAMN06296386_11496 [Lachnospiraceae bacterium]
MKEFERNDLISQLATSMGVPDMERLKNGASYFDSSTGTLYCKGQAITRSTAEKAIRHFELMESRCDVSDGDQRKMALIYRCVIEAIRIMGDSDVIALMKKKAT